MTFCHRLWPSCCFGIAMRAPRRLLGKYFSTFFVRLICAVSCKQSCQLCNFVSRQRFPSSISNVALHEEILYRVPGAPLQERNRRRRNSNAHVRQRPEELEVRYALWKLLCAWIGGLLHTIVWVYTVCFKFFFSGQERCERIFLRRTSTYVERCSKCIVCQFLIECFYNVRAFVCIKASLWVHSHEPGENDACQPFSCQNILLVCFEFVSSFRMRFLWSVHACTPSSNRVTDVRKNLWQMLICYRRSYQGNEHFILLLCPHFLHGF